MARRRSRRFRRSSKRWSSNIQEIGGLFSATAGTWSNSETIIQNPVQTPSLVTQRYTVKNVEISFDIDGVDTNYIEGITVYIMFVPQGFTVTDDYNLQHPEYIMAYKYLGSPTEDVGGQQYQPIRIRSRLARKLDSGDQLILFIKGTNQSQAPNTLRVDGIVRWWTKAN